MVLSTDKEKATDFFGEAIRKGTIKLAFQPIYRGNVSSGKEVFEKAEVLCRLEFGGEIVMPGDFIPFAEKNNLIDDLTERILKTLGAFIKSNPQLCEVIFSVNVSPVQLRKQGFARKFFSWIQGYGLNPEKIIVEITETSSYGTKGVESKNLEHLRDFGFLLALDDFGKGSSDLEKITRLPISYIKIDKTYIDRLQEHGVERMLRALIVYASRTGRECVAEGIEEDWQKIILQKIKCHYFQGYLFSRPLYEENFLFAFTESRMFALVKEREIFLSAALNSEMAVAQK